MRVLSLIAPRRTNGRRRKYKGGPARRPLRRVTDRRGRLRMGAAALLLPTIAGLGWLWHDGWMAEQAAWAGRALYAASARAGLKVTDILVEGRVRTKRSTLLEILDLERDDPILAFDPQSTRRGLEALPWVARASVERRLPDVVFVRLAEREPLALWQRDGELSVIDHGGTVIPGVPAGAFAHLPLVVGADAAEHATKLLAMLEAEPSLKDMVAAAVRVHGRRWNLQLENGIDVRLPELDPAAAWTQLARIQREHGVLERDVITIDLRMPDRLVVRTAPGATPKGARPPAGEDT